LCGEIVKRYEGELNLGYGIKGRNVSTMMRDLCTVLVGKTGCSSISCYHYTTFKEIALEDPYIPSIPNC